MNFSFFRRCLIIIFGNILYAVAVLYFVLPTDILSGGVAGIALIAEKLFNWDTIIVIDVLVAITFVLSYVFLGKEMAANTLLSSIAYPLALSVLSLFPYQIEANPILMTVFGAVIAGIGIGIVVRENASSGGTDVLALILSKFAHLSVGTSMFIIDGIITLGALLTYSIENIMYGLAFIYITNVVVDKIVIPASGGVALFIITDKIDEVCQFIHVDLFRGTTLLKAQGGYTGNERNVILTVVARKEYPELSEKLAQIDPTAFIIVSDAKDIKGEGFTYEYRV